MRGTYSSEKLKVKSENGGGDANVHSDILDLYGFAGAYRRSSEKRKAKMVKGDSGSV